MRETPRHNYQILTKRPDRMTELVSGKIGEVLPNVWLGTSIENADVVNRVEHLHRAPAAIRFISFEQLIGSAGAVDLQDIHWAIVGEPVSLLTGLLTCGCCGGKFGIVTPSRYACLNHHRRGT